MLSVRHSSGTPPMSSGASTRQPSRASAAFDVGWTDTCGLDQESVATETSKSHRRPRLSCTESPPSRTAAGPGGRLEARVRLARRRARLDPGPPAVLREGAVPRQPEVGPPVRQVLVDGPLGDPRQRSPLEHHVPHLVERAHPVPLPSCGDGPSPQWRATVCLSRPYRLPMSGRLGFTPVCLHMLGSPITFLSTCAPPFRDWPSRKEHAALVPLARPPWSPWRIRVGAFGGMRWPDWHCSCWQ